jgi:hypothetical protein
MAFVASLAHLGRLENARHERQLFMISNPHFTTRQWSDSQPFREEKTWQHYVEGYCKAGPRE